MKKMMIAALMFLGTSAVFAGDSEPLKAILKAKTYEEAAGLLKTNLSQLASAAEKAAAYNKLVDLAMDKVGKEQAIINSNQMAVQFKQGKVEAYDTLGFYNAVYNAMSNGMLANTFDQQPNEKGKVKPKFESSNSNRLYNVRPQLINGGQEFGKKENQAEALKYFGLYVESSEDPLFKNIDKTKNPDQYLGEVARVAAVYAFQNKELERANKYCDIAMKDTAVYKEALNLKMYLMQQSLKTKADSLQYVETLKGIYAKDSKNEQIFATLANMYGSLKMTSEQTQFIEDKIAQDPKCFSAWALKGQNAMNANKLDEATSSFKKALEIDGQNVVVLTYLGFTINAQAGAISGNTAEQKKLYEESTAILEKARSLDPTREKANWSYPLYQCYYSLYGANDARTKEMEALNK
uniref:Tetratricopeptide repeat protein n=3 Tax=unclassified Prevotella TaxID=2638335 RepID=A0AB33JNQ1_9BACT